MTPCHPDRHLVSPQARGGRPGAGDPSSSREAAWGCRGHFTSNREKETLSIVTVVVRPGGAEGSHTGQSRGELRPGVAIAAIMCHGASGSVCNGIGARGGLQPSSVAPPGVSPCYARSADAMGLHRGQQQLAAERQGMEPVRCRTRGRFRGSVLALSNPPPTQRARIYRQLGASRQRARWRASGRRHSWDGTL